jgi:hypothetical protein
VGGILVLKYAINKLEWEALTITSLHTGILAGTVFVLGFILSGVHTDYKESEKIPVDIVNAVASLQQDALLLKSKEPSFDYNGFTKILKDLLHLFKKDIESHGRESLEEIKKLGEYFLEMEKLNVPANYIVKLKQDQSIILRNMLRAHYLLRISPLPSAFILVVSIVVISITLLLFTKIGALVDGLVTLGFFSFVYIYLLRLIQVMDKPFHAEGTTQDDVSLFLVEEQIKKLS